MAGENYTTCAIPNDLSSRIDKIIQNGELGYKSRGEFIKEAIRLLLRKLNGENPIAKKEVE